MPYVSTKFEDNADGTILASAARTTAQTGADLTNYGARGVIVFLNVTNASGTGGLTVNIEVKDPVSGVYTAILTASAAVIANAMRTYIIYPGGASGGTQGVSGPLPRTWRVRVTVGDASSYTYSLGYSYCP